MVRRSILAVSVLALVALLGLAPGALGKPFEGSTLEGSVDYPAASGKAKMEETRGVLYFVAEVSDVQELIGTELYLFIGEVEAGGMMIRPSGNGRRAVPLIPGSPVTEVPAGTPIQLRTGAGVVVVSGTFN